MPTDAEKKVAASIGLTPEGFDLLKAHHEAAMSLTEEERAIAEATGVSIENYTRHRNEYQAERAADAALWAGFDEYAAEAATTAPRGRGLPLPPPEPEE
jgi:hypothetical protein